MGLKEGIDILMEKMGLSEEGAEKSIRFATEKWKLYFPCYYMGYRLISDLFTNFGRKSLKPVYTFNNLSTIHSTL